MTGRRKFQAKRGAIACGHPATAAAARQILEAGGNAFDAALAAFCAATVAEPILCSLGGGGFLLAQPAAGAPCLYDFFVQTPCRKRPEQELDFYPILADFGTATQEFHIGLGAMGTPGAIKGLFAVHKDLGSLPMARLVEPAVELARKGLVLRPIDAYIFSVVGPVLLADPKSKTIYTDSEGALLAPGAMMRQPALGDTLEALGREGAALFYEGDLAKRLVALCRDAGGQLTAEDLKSYAVARRPPLERRYRDARILTNPPPSSGGILIAFALELLARRELGELGFGAPEHLSLLGKVMALTNRARVESRLHEALSETEEANAAARLLDPALLAAYGAEVAGRAHNPRGTTHLSVIDGDGNVAALSLSNGEGCGIVLQDTGIMLNNVLGEEDLNPRGFHYWPENSRVSSMMAPSLAFLADGSVAALGTGGSNRIRTSILQVLSNLIDFAMTAEEAVAAPRLHHEDGLANLEQGYDAASSRALAAVSEEIMDWPPLSFFFGGVHCAARAADGSLTAAADARREGAGVLV